MVLSSLATLLADAGKLPEALAAARRVEAVEGWVALPGDEPSLYALALVAAIRFASGDRAGGQARLEAIYRGPSSAEMEGLARALLLRLVGDARRAGQSAG
ncbi:hypothetical protein [Rubrivirga sp. IMCC43871]|uniref:hypothetical protein n=1 Tax=Rubrivirga sp. IMCC43871 TaxID=3391575 RepID=UPI0039900CA7